MLKFFLNEKSKYIEKITINNEFYFNTKKKSKKRVSFIQIQKVCSVFKTINL